MSRRWLPPPTPGAWAVRQLCFVNCSTVPFSVSAGELTIG